MINFFCNFWMKIKSNQLDFIHTVNLKRATSFPWASVTRVSYLKDHVHEFVFCLIASNTTIPLASDISHLLVNTGFFPACLIVYWAGSNRQYCLPITGPPIDSARLPMADLPTPKLYFFCSRNEVLASNYYQNPDHTYVKQVENMNDTRI